MVVAGILDRRRDSFSRGTGLDCAVRDYVLS